jgi:hypothetical protein
LEHDTRESGKLHCGNFRSGELHDCESKVRGYAQRDDAPHRVRRLPDIGHVRACVLPSHAGGTADPAIDAAATAARVNDVSGVLESVSDDFTGNGGDFDKRGLHRLLALRALRQDKTGVLIGPVSFERKGDRILAKFNLVLTGGKTGDLLPDQSAIYAMTTAWRRESGDWKCYSAVWSRR